MNNDGIDELIRREAIRYHERRSKSAAPPRICSRVQVVRTGNLVPVRQAAAASTIEALMYELRTYGVEALKYPNCQRRLSELTDKQLADVIERLMNLRSQYSAITDRLLTQLVRLSS
jgi:hypothetical protein